MEDKYDGHNEPWNAEGDSDAAVLVRSQSMLWLLDSACERIWNDLNLEWNEMPFSCIRFVQKRNFSLFNKLSL